MLEHFTQVTTSALRLQPPMPGCLTSPASCNAAQINAEKSPFLTEKLKIWMLPTLALIKNEKVEDYVVGFQDLGNSDEFETELLAERLAKSEMIDYDFPRLRPQQATQAKVRKGGFQKTESDEDSDFD